MSRVSKAGQKNAIGIILNFVWMFVVYRACVFWSEQINSIIPYAICASLFLIAVSVLLVVYYFTADPKNPGERNKKLLVWAFPILVCLIVDVLDLMILDYIISLFKN